MLNYLSSQRCMHYFIKKRIALGWFFFHTVAFQYSK